MGVFDKPSAWYGLESVYRDYIADLTPVRTIVEIGVDYGWSFFHFAMHYPGATVIGVDDYSAQYANHHDAEAWVRSHLPEFRNAVLVKSPSVVAAWLIACTVDLLHIDAVHTYDDLNADFQAWEPKVRSGGCVMFHDTESFPEVRRFFDELPGQKLNIPKHHGLGFWYKP